jgi:hypothetical protein
MIPGQSASVGDMPANQGYQQKQIIKCMYAILQQFHAIPLIFVHKIHEITNDRRRQRRRTRP